MTTSDAGERQAGETGQVVRLAVTGWRLYYAARLGVIDIPAIIEFCDQAGAATGSPPQIRPRRQNLSEMAAVVERAILDLESLLRPHVMV